jgi:alpha,alpha-trehalase
LLQSQIINHGGVQRRLILALCALALLGCQRAETPAPYWQASRPAFVFAELYARVESEQLFADSKTFADAQPLRAPALILRDYRAAVPGDRAQLTAFVQHNFAPPTIWPEAPPPNLDLPHFIAALWPLLRRPSSQPPEYASALGLPFAYLVPGGRLRELHYTEGYFMMLGLIRDGQREFAQGVLDDCAALINRFGHVPAGTRTYYLSRSGLPLFYRMIGLLYPDDPAAGYASYLAELKREYSFWMQGSVGLAPGRSIEHVVAMPDGALLNRFWDALGEPRDEAFREDRALAAHSAREAPALYRDLRAAAESGWGLSTRWLADVGHPDSVQTTALVPVDLNSVLFGLERAIAAGCERRGDQPCATQFLARAWRRKQAINHYLWSAADGRYVDYNWQQGRASNVVSAGMLYPLFTGIASRAQADAVALLTSQRLLGEEGLAATSPWGAHPGSSPDVWAPLQWIAVQGLSDYGQLGLAQTIAERWLGYVKRDFAVTGQLRERFAADGAYAVAGDEGLPEGTLGGTAGVVRALLSYAPERGKIEPPNLVRGLIMSAPGGIGTAPRK